MINHEVFFSLVAKNNVLVSDEDKAYAAHDRSHGLPKVIPAVVVKVSSGQELINCVQACLSYKTPLTIRACGTGRTGGAISCAGGVVIDVSGLNRILSIDTENLTVEVEPGVLLKDLKDAVKEHGLYYPIDPASEDICSIGGNVAENAAGPSTVKYGTTRDYLLGGEAIIGTGEIIKFGKQCVKGVAGLDVASLLCGSEGTLAVFTKLRLRLIPYPQGHACGIYYFRHEHEAIVAVNYLFHNGYRPKRLEYIDSISLRALGRMLPNMPMLKHPALLIECDAHNNQSAYAELCAITDILTPLLVNKKTLETPQDYHDVWQSRALLSEACSTYLGHKFSEDIAVPLGKLNDLRIIAQSLSSPPHLMLGLFGHAGDGNLHVQIMFDDPSWAERAAFVSQELLKKVLDLGGTVAAEHGIGIKKKQALIMEQSEALIALQKRLKLAFDPHNLLNPGKIFDL